MHVICKFQTPPHWSQIKSPHTAEYVCSVEYDQQIEISHYTVHSLASVEYYGMYHVLIILTLSFGYWDSCLSSYPVCNKRSFRSEINNVFKNSLIFTDDMLKICYAINCFQNSKFPVLNHHLNSVGEYTQFIILMYTLG